MSVTFSTVRLTLRPLCARDAQEMFRAWNDPEVGRYLWDGRAVGRDEVDEVIAASERLFRARGWGIWAIETEGRVVGFCGLRPAPFPTGVEGDVELLYGLARAEWGRGYCTEAVEAVLEWLRGRDDPRHVVAGVDPDNAASVRVLERVGLSNCARGATETGQPLLLYRVRG